MFNAIYPPRILNKRISIIWLDPIDQQNKKSALPQILPQAIYLSDGNSI